LNIFDILSKENNEDNFLIEEINEDSSNGNIFEQLAKQEKEKNEFGFLETAKDVAKQVTSKGVSGFLGGIGNILDAFGLQLKEGQTLPGQQEINKIQSDLLDKMNRGESLSFGEMLLLSDDEGLPSGMRLPTSREIQKAITATTGIGEGETPIGRIAGRGAEMLGEGAATGGGIKALTSLGLSGIAGQGIREAGGPEIAAQGTEILGSLLPAAFSKKLIPSGKETKDFVEAGRKIGLSEEQLTPLIQGEKKVATLSKIARKGTKTKELFSSIKETLGDSYSTIKSTKEAKKTIPIVQQTKLKKEFNSIRDELSKTLAPSPDKESAINYISRSIETLKKNDLTPEYLINFWQDINKSVKWNSIQGGKKSLTQLKDPISNTLKKISPNLAKDFEMTNDLYSKYAQISKKLKPDFIDSIVNKAEILGAAAAGVALVTGNLDALIGLASIGLASEASLRLLSREMLINPYFQNVAKKLVVNFNQSSMRGVSETVKQVREFLERKHPNEDWSFLTDVND